MENIKRSNGGIVKNEQTFILFDKDKSIIFKDR